MTREQKRRRQRIRADIIAALTVAAIAAAGFAAGRASAAGFAHGACMKPVHPVVLRAEKSFLPEPPENNTPLSDSCYTALLDACETHGVPLEIALGVIQAESSFQPDAVSSAGCYGLMQLNPEYFPSGLSSEENISAGVAYLAYQLRRYDGDMDAALCAYRAGHDNGERWYTRAVYDAAENWRLI